MEWLADLYDAHADALYGFVLNLTRSGAESEDIVHDLFLKLARDEKRLRPLAAQKSYLFTMAHRAVIDAVRRRQARERRYEGAAAEGPVALFRPDPDQNLLASEASRALASLPVEQRAVVHLKLWENFTFAEIATALDIPPDTAASRYRYGLDKMRDRLRFIYKELRDGT